MLDKVEPPSIPEGYAMSVAFSALLDLVRGITTMIERELASEEEAAAEFREAHPDQEWQPPPGLEMSYIQIIDEEEKIWTSSTTLCFLHRSPCGLGGDGQCLLVWPLSCLVFAFRCQVGRKLDRFHYFRCKCECVYIFLLSHPFSTDETATENILKAELTMASLCGRLGLVTPRDAFITAICKASLPPHYALTVLSSNGASLSSKGAERALSVRRTLICISVRLMSCSAPRILEKASRKNQLNTNCRHFARPFWPTVVILNFAPCLN